MIFITGWNEWVAQRQPMALKDEPIFFCGLCKPEH